ncbi:MAG: Co2+/Mg2+ efflux protein ApaG [Proteobacteria bacterium]|nr:Co2+/Mg2+ efflux protein ApaG [Pseudomonadota bacterium]
MENSKSQLQDAAGLGQFTYRENTEGVEIQVRPEYLPRHSRPDQGMYTWSYTVTMINHGSRRLQLLNRLWIITDGKGRIDEVSGVGVIGEQPILLPNTSYTYTSGCPLKTPTGNMRGWYDFVDLDTNQKIKTRIPLFFLRSDIVLH